MLPDLLGPDAPPNDLRFTGPDGSERSDVPVVLVSNNPYVLAHVGGMGTRGRLDTGELGIAVVDVRTAADLTRLVVAEAAGQLPAFEGFDQWSSPTFEIRSGGPIEAGVDGEALVFDPPLAFRSLPGALRVRVPQAARSDEAVEVHATIAGTVVELARVAFAGPW
jgi:diacylglycerol kinase family enzyme